MPLSGDAVRSLATGISNQGAAKEIAAAINASVASPATVIAALGATVITAIGATTALTAVPASFADVAAVRTYLAGAHVVPGADARLGVVEVQCDLISGQLNTLNAKVDALIAALKAAGLMATS